MHNPSSTKGTKHPVYFVVVKNGVQHSTWIDSAFALRCRNILRKRGDTADCVSFIPKVTKPKLPVRKERFAA